jgi:penicillin-binding protein 1C
MRRLVARTVALVGLGVAGLGAWIAWPLPAGLLTPPAAPSVTLRDRHGVVLRTTRAVDGSRRRWVALSDIDPQVVQAFVAVEDRRFFEHHGVDARAVGRALVAAVREGRTVSGASTITMQLARMLTGAGRSWPGKMAQVAWAWRLEAHIGKQAILEQYLNRVSLGQGAVGVDAASALYFGGGAGTVGLAHAALLAGVAHAPSRDDPFAAPARAHARRAYALARVRAAGYATAADIERANLEPLVARGVAAAFLAPHFTSHVLNVTREDAGETDLVTSLDLGLQTELETEVRATVAALRTRGVRQAAVVVLDNRTGEVLAWVGSPDFWADSAGQADMVVSPRQPGSALKPFLYGLAFDHGFTAASVLADVARTYRTALGAYHPRNYDRRFHGPVRSREALASSYNVPAVALADTLGVEQLLRTLRLAGFASLSRSGEYYGLGLALGNGDVTLLELANAYRSLAVGGVWHPVRLTLGGATPDGAPRRVVSASSASLVLDILSDADARVPGFGTVTPFDFAFPVAVKTGTSRHFTDNWAVGTTGGFTVAVWAGNFTGQPMDGVSGVTGAGPLLHRAVLLTARRYAPGALPSPASTGAEPVRVCRLSGMRAGPECPYATEWFAPGTSPSATCDWHVAGRVRVPPVFAEWAPRTDTVTRARSSDSRDRGVHILSPQEGDRYEVPPGVDRHYATIALRATGASDVRWWIDGRPVGAPRWTLVPGAHTVTARDGTGESASVRFEVQ